MDLRDHEVGVEQSAETRFGPSPVVLRVRVVTVDAVGRENESAAVAEQSSRLSEMSTWIRDVLQYLGRQNDVERPVRSRDVSVSDDEIGASTWEVSGDYLRPTEQWSVGGRAGAEVEEPAGRQWTGNLLEHLSELVEDRLRVMRARRSEAIGWRHVADDRDRWREPPASGTTQRRAPGL